MARQVVTIKPRGNAGIGLFPSGGSLYALPSNRITTWMPGVSYAPTSGPYAPVNAPTGWTGGIPTALYTQSGSTISPSGGDDTATINAALATAGTAASQSAPKFVQLAAGTFTITGNGLQILKNYVGLKGSGPGPGMKGAISTVPTTGGTFLVKSDGSTHEAPNITIGAGANGGGAVGLNTMASTTNFAADCVAGTNSGTVGSVSGLSIGQIVYVNELYDSSQTLTWYNTNQGDQGGTTTGFNGWAEGGDGVSAVSRPIGQAMEIASIVGLVVTFTTPFHQTYRSSKTCHLGVPNMGSGVPARWCFIESLFVTGGDGGDGGGNLVINSASSYCWIKNVESSGHGPNFGGGLVHLYSTFRCEVRDSYLHGNAADINRISPGGGFYNIVLDAYLADNLIENNISWIGNKVMVMRSSGGGNVISYNYMDDGYGIDYMNQMETALNSDHMATSHHDLFEGNYSWQFGTDSRWGNSIYTTWFRNWGSSYRASAWPSLVGASSCAFGNPLLNKHDSPDTPGIYFEDGFNRNPGKVGSHHFGFNYLGNVLGVSGSMLLGSPRSSGGVPAQTAWQYEWYPPSSPSGLSDTTIPIWQFGTPDGSEPAFPNNGLDNSVLPTTLRDANYDFFTGLVHWHGIGGVATNFATGAGAVTPPGASVGGTVLPNSLYITGSAPSFFSSAGSVTNGSTVWPPIDGSNASNPLPGAIPAKARFEAGTPNVI